MESNPKTIFQKSVRNNNSTKNLKRLTTQEMWKCCYDPNRTWLVNVSNTGTNALRKKSENIFFENFQNGRQVNFGKKI